MDRIEALKADVDRLTADVAAAGQEVTAARLASSDVGLTDAARRQQRGRAEAAERRQRKLRGDLRLAKARLREAERSR
jgi:hypothetical protein